MVPTDSPSLLPPVWTSGDNLTLSCTVAGEGRFSWQWTDPDGNPPSAVILSNVTRTSIATFTNYIRGTGGGTLHEKEPHLHLYSHLQPSRVWCGEE